MHPTLTYAIIEDGQPMDGEFFDKTTLFRKLEYAERDARVAEFDLAEFIRDGRSSFTDVTEDMVQAAYDAGHLTRDDAIVAAVLDLPETHDEHAGNLADAAWHQRGAA